MKRIALIGSGDLSKQLICYINEQNEYTIYGIYDDFSNEKKIEEIKSEVVLIKF